MNTATKDLLESITKNILELTNIIEQKDIELFELKAELNIHIPRLYVGAKVRTNTDYGVVHSDKPFRGIISKIDNTAVEIVTCCGVIRKTSTYWIELDDEFAEHGAIVSTMNDCPQAKHTDPIIISICHVVKCVNNNCTKCNWGNKS